VKDNKMTLLEQNESLPHKPGDVITVFSKPNWSEPSHGDLWSIVPISIN